MIAKVKNLLDMTLSALEIVYKIARGIDYRTLNDYILSINRLHEIDRILYEVSKCLRDILDYELFGFIIRDGSKLDIWIDPRIQTGNFLSYVGKDFPSDSYEYLVHHFEGKDSVACPEAVCIDTGSLLSFNVISNDQYTARLYIIPRRTMLSYHMGIIEKIAQTVAVAIENSIHIGDLRTAAFIDPLTGCGNRRSLDSLLHTEISRVRRYGGDLSVVIFDIDHFKKVNDSYGHATGDAVLAQTARTVRQHIRTCDSLARYGGEEFVVVLPQTKIGDAILLAERMRDAVEKMTVTGEGKNISVTASFGVASLDIDDVPESLLARADTVMYVAKKRGRNRVEPHGTLHPEKIFSDSAVEKLYEPAAA